MKTGIRENAVRMGAAAILGATALGFAAAPPAFAHGSHGHDIIIDGDGDLLERLIELDAEGIEHMRADFAEARTEIEDAIADIEEAREDVRDVPGGAFIAKIAFRMARGAATGAVEEALDEVRGEVDKASRDLVRADVSDEERAETEEAIRVLREEMAALEVSLDKLVAALDA